MKAHATPITNQPLDGVSRLLTSLDDALENARKISKLTLEQEDRLRRKLDVRDHPVFDFLRTDDRGHDWHWQRYIYEPLLPREGNSYQRLYAAVRGPDDRTVGDIADFMIRLGKEVLKL